MTEEQREGDWPEPAPDPEREPAESLDDDGTPGAVPPDDELDDESEGELEEGA